jgi:hypothetical protein
MDQHAFADQPVFAFGRHPPAEVKVVAWFGARCILNWLRDPDGNGGRAHIDWVPDRRGAWPDPLPDDFRQWAVSKGFEWVDQLPGWAENRPRLRGDSSHVFTLDDGPYHAEASCQASHGYLYVGMWKRAVSEQVQ